MNSTIMIATAILAGTATMFYVMTRRRKTAQPDVQHTESPGRHLTNVFAKAKQGVL